MLTVTEQMVSLSKTASMCRKERAFNVMSLVYLLCMYCCGCGGRQYGLRQCSRLSAVVWLVSQYRVCQVASLKQTDRQTGKFVIAAALRLSLTT